MGNLYIYENTVYGISLIEAHELETTKAINPRIIFSDEVKALIRKHLGFYASVHDAPQGTYLLKDIDGEYFVNYLVAVLDDEDNPMYDSVRKHKEVVENRLNIHSNEPHLLAKYVWCAEYHNYFCHNFIHNCPAQYLITAINSNRAFTLIP